MPAENSTPENSVSHSRRSVLAAMGATLTIGAVGGVASAAPTRVSFASPPGASSPSSGVAPDDGFASTDWLTERPLSVVRVTNLNREGPGSLRAAMNRDVAGEGRIVVFEVGGVIDLEGKQLDPETDNMFVAGQTAPPPGITIIRGGFEIDGTNNVIQHIRVRTGTGVAGDNEGEGAAADSITIQDESENVIIDHCTATWGSDENMSVGDSCRAITFSNSLIAEGLAEPDMHPDEGEHSNGTLVGHDSADVAILGNLYANSNDRHPRLKGGTKTAVVNNAVYNFDDAIMLGDDAESNADDAYPTQASIVANVYRPGANTPHDPLVTVNDEDDVLPVEISLADNVIQGPLSMVGNDPDPRLAIADAPPVWPASLTPIAPDAVFGNATTAAGAHPAQRSAHDARVVHDVRSKGGAIIDSEREVGGYPDPEPVVRELELPSGDLDAWLARFTRAVERRT